MQLSKRLRAVAGMLDAGKECLADVGCDHGYVSIYLIQHGVCAHAIAMDVRKGPLERAKEHIQQFGLEKKIQTRLSDGVEGLEPGEADCMVVAGMGGALTIHILEKGEAVIAQMKECVLQPQSEIAKVREYLWAHHYSITAEDMVLEDGKFYPLMKVVPGQKAAVPKELYELYAQYGQLLLEEKHPVLRQFVEKEYNRNIRLTKQLELRENVEERLLELQGKRILMKQALEMLE